MSLIRLENVSLARQGKTLLSNLNWSVEKARPGLSLDLMVQENQHFYAYWQLSSFLPKVMLKYLAIPLVMETSRVFANISVLSVPSSLSVCLSIWLQKKIVLTGKYKSSILYKAYGDKELQEAKDMLTSLGAGDLIGRKYHGLSQGEKQICLIARSLMEDPDIIILDEATVGLDLFAREKLLRQIDHITSLPHAPLVLYVTHHAEITENMDHILLLRQGKIVAQGPKNDVITPEVLADFYQNPVQIIPIDDHRFYINPLL